MSVCSGMDVTYEHELAHAWARWNLDPSERDAFMERRGHLAWNDHDLPWNERATEDLAVIVQQGVAGLPLPPVLGREWTARMDAYELVTGRIAPVLVDWLQARAVPCHDRPTPLSRAVPDTDGRICVETVTKPV